MKGVAMTNYSDNPGMVRVEYFKPSGKWYMTEAIDMSAHWDDAYVWDAVKASLDDSRPDKSPGWWKHFTVVCLEPYHKSAYPQMFVADSWE